MAEIVGTAVGVISLGIQVCQGLLQYYGSWKDATSDVIEMLTAVKSLARILEELEVTIKGKGVVETMVQENILACRGSIEKLNKKLLHVQDIKGSSIWAKVHGQGRRLLYPFQENTILKLRKLISDTQGNLSHAVSVLELKTTIDMSAQVKDVADDFEKLSTFVFSHHKDQESQKIIEWLSPLNFFITHNDIFQRRQEGTGEWLFETSEFKEWLSGSQKVLWCSGMPGSGKTVLASAIIDMLDSKLSAPKCGLAFVYCNYKEQHDQTLAKLTASLVKQLVQCSEVIPDGVYNLYKQHNNRKTKPSEAEYLTLLKTLITGFSQIYIVVDALDECNERDGTRSKFIRELLHLPENLHLLCTSRHLGDIEKSFWGASRLEIRAISADVKAYLHSRISDDGDLAEYCEIDTDLRNDIVETLSEKADGMFLLAQLHVRSLAEESSPNSVRRALKSLPRELAETYSDAMNRIRKLSQRNSELALRMLSWITHSTRPLEVAEIRHAMAIADLSSDKNCIDEGDLPIQTRLITVCGGLVIVDSESRVIRLVHYTTQEYFEKHREENFPNAHLEISRACIRYLSMNPFKEGPCKTLSKTANRLEKYRLVRYASQNWDNHYHSNHVHNQLENKVEEDILQFLHQSSLLSSMIQAREYPYYLHKFFVIEVPGLVVAAGSGLIKIVARMLKAENDIEGKEGDGETALFKAANNGHLEVAKLLLENNVDAGAQDNSGSTPLHKAAINGHLEVVKLLLENNVDAGAQDNSGSTPLHEAAAYGNLEVVKLLLQNNADINAQTWKGKTAFNIAVYKGHEAVASLLVENGADVDATTLNVAF